MKKNQMKRRPKIINEKLTCLNIMYVRSSLSLQCHIQLISSSRNDLELVVVI